MNQIRMYNYLFRRECGHKDVYLGMDSEKTVCKIDELG